MLYNLYGESCSTGHPPILAFWYEKGLTLQPGLEVSRKERMERDSTSNRAGGEGLGDL